MRILMAVVVTGLIAALAAGIGRAADGTSEGKIAELAAELAAFKDQAARSEARLSALTARLEHAERAALIAKAAIAEQLAQPVLLLVGMGPCPTGFKRIETRVLILTRARTSANGHLFDEAGLPYEDPPGVGDNVYRDLDFCFRPANSVTLD